MSKWIPVTKQMPMTGQNVLLCDNEGGIFIGAYFDYDEEETDAFYTGPFWLFQHDDEDFCFDEPIAWMPLPEPVRLESGEPNEDDAIQALKDSGMLNRL